MKLLLHVSSILSQGEKNWLNNNGYNLSQDNWLDVTTFAPYFRQEEIADFCLMVCEATAVDMTFDRWKMTF